MSALVPNLPLLTAPPVLTLNSRDFGFGVFRIRLRVFDNAGHVSPIAADAAVIIERGGTAVAVLRAPSAVLSGQPFAWTGVESFGNDGLPILEYRWTIEATNGSFSWATRVPQTIVGGPAVSPNDPVPRDLPPGRYLATLVVADDTNLPSPPHTVPFVVRDRAELEPRVAAIPRVRANGQVVDIAPAASVIELDGKDSFVLPAGFGLAIDRLVWTWFPVGATTPDGRLWDQRETPEAVFQPDWELRPGLHRFRLVAFDGEGNRSEPADTLIQLT